MSERPWYKRYPSDFIHGTLRLTFEEKGAYSIILDLIYDKGGPIDDDEKWIARALSITTRKWRPIKEELIKKGKLYVQDGKLGNQRADRVLGKVTKTAPKRDENGTKTPPKVAENEPDLFNNNDLPKTHTRSQNLEARNQKKDKEHPLFKKFYSEYPQKVAPKKASDAFWKAIELATIEEILNGLKNYIKHKPDWQEWAHPASWLNSKRWLDSYAPQKTSQTKPKSNNNLELQIAESMRLPE